MHYASELGVALEAAGQAARLIREHYVRFEKIADAPADITTASDRESQALILGHIHKVFPADALCAEEATPGFVGLSITGPRQWIVDPIDGTRGFARKNGEFSVMVAFVDRGEVAVGVVWEPAFGKVTYATRGGGCWRRDQDGGEPRQCQVTAVSELARATLIQSHSRKTEAPSWQLQALQPGRVVESYSAGVKLARVARGDADIYLNTYERYHDWDIAAGQILVEEAGGRVTNLEGEAPEYGQHEAVQLHGLVATNGLLQEPALAALRTSRRDA